VEEYLSGRSAELQNVSATDSLGVPFERIFLAAEKLRSSDDKGEALEKLCAMIAELQPESADLHAVIERREFDHE
jgi:hypothetical protein